MGLVFHDQNGNVISRLGVFNTDMAISSSIDHQYCGGAHAYFLSAKLAISSIGYEGLTVDSFLHKLIANNITVVMDVRSNPQSMKYGFSKKSFKQYIESAGLALPKARRDDVSRVEGMKCIHYTKWEFTPPCARDLAKAFPRDLTCLRERLVNRDPCPRNRHNGQ